jgi:hypothetical protein
VSDAAPDAVIDLFVCIVCGRRDADVRDCCYRPAAERTCRSCYQSGKGDHARHVGEVYDMNPTPRPHKIRGK